MLTNSNKIIDRRNIKDRISTQQKALILKEIRQIKNIKNTSRSVSQQKQNKNSINTINKNQKHTLRQRINKQLQAYKKPLKTSNKIPNNENKCIASSRVCKHELSCLRKMLTQQSEQKDKRWEIKDQINIYKIKRDEQRKQFEMRQSIAIKKKIERQSNGIYQRERNEIIGCTFKPKLTVYKRI